VGGTAQKSTIGTSVAAVALLMNICPFPAALMRLPLCPDLAANEERHSLQPLLLSYVSHHLY